MTPDGRFLAWTRASLAVLACAYIYAELNDSPFLQFALLMPIHLPLLFCTGGFIDLVEMDKPIAVAVRSSAILLIGMGIYWLSAKYVRTSLPSYRELLLASVYCWVVLSLLYLGYVALLMEGWGNVFSE